MAEHHLKLDSHYFDAVASGDKNFEVRRDDRGFQKGDIEKAAALLAVAIFFHGCATMGSGMSANDATQIKRGLTEIADAIRATP